LHGDGRRSARRINLSLFARLAAAIRPASDAQRDGSRWSFEDRAAVFLKAADLLAGPWRQKPNAATMLGQSNIADQVELRRSRTGR
jgi:1-pyrroline-5-carboxylate dehydrogenase